MNQRLAEHATTEKQKKSSCCSLPLWGEINLCNKWAEEHVLGHGRGCQKEVISFANPRQRFQACFRAMVLVK